MIENLTQFVAIGLVGTILAAWRAVPILGVVLMIDLLFRRRIKARFQCGLWLLVLARLVLPVSVSSPLGLSELSDRTAQRTLDSLLEPAPEPKPEFDVITFPLWGGEMVSVPVLPKDVKVEVRSRANAFAAEVHAKRMLQQAERKKTPEAIPPAQEFNEDIVAYPLIWTWAIVSLLIIALGLFKFFRFAKHVKRCPRITEPAILAATVEICRSLGIARCPQIRQVDTLSAPAVFGIRKPILCLTSQVSISEEELKWVLRHELAHMKRRDPLVLAIAQVIRSLHWFNPIAWLVVSKLRTHIEQAADDLATKGMSTEQLVSYGHLLLRSATQDRAATKFAIVGLLSFSSKNSLLRRIEMLGVSRVPSHWLNRLLSAIFLCVLATAGLTDASAVKTDRTHPGTLPEQGSVELYGWSDKPEPEELVTLEVGSSMEKARSLQPGIDAEYLVSRHFFPDVKEYILDEGKLQASLTPNQHRRASQMLQGFRRSGPWQIAIECRMVEAPVSIARDLDWDSTAFMTEGNILSLSDSGVTGDEHHSFALRLKSEFASRPALEAKLSEIDLPLFIHRYQSDRLAQCLFAPKVTVFNGQSVTIARNTPRSFVTGFVKEPKAPDVDSPDSTREFGFFQPHIETIADGVSIQLSLQVAAPNRVELDCVIVESEIRSADSLASLPIASSDDPRGDMVIQTPEVYRTNLGSHTQLADHESLCLLSPKRQFKNGKSEGRARFYIITAHMIDDSEMLESFVRKVETK